MACGDDIPQLMPLIRQYWEFDGISGFDPGRIEPVLSRLLADLRLGTVWVAQSGERLIGYLVAVCLLSLEHQGLMRRSTSCSWSRKSARAALADSSLRRQSVPWWRLGACACSSR